MTFTNGQPRHPTRGKGKCYAWIVANASHQGDECLLWPFFVNPKGYGVLGHCGRMYRANRLMCQVAWGDPPTPFHVAAHKCNNRACCNPKHLIWKTSTDNHLDQRSAGTHVTSRYGRKGILSYAGVAAIRAAEGTMTQAKLAYLYEVSADTIRRIHRGQTYTGKVIDWFAINQRSAWKRRKSNRKAA